MLQNCQLIFASSSTIHLFFDCFEFPLQELASFAAMSRLCLLLVHAFSKITTVEFSSIKMMVFDYG